MEKICSCKNWQETRDVLVSDICSLKFKVVNKRTMNLFKSSKEFGFSNFIWWDREV